MFNERDQAFKTEFMMIQSCERRRDEMLYKRTNRKFLNFNIDNKQQMAQVGKSLKPFGFLQTMQHKAFASRIELLRIWAETRLAKRGEQYLRKLYRESPEKFFDVRFTMGNARMRLSECKYILSDNSSQKTISLANDDFFSDEMEHVRKRLLAKEETFADEQKLAKEFTPNEGDQPETPSFIAQMAIRNSR